MSGPLVLGLNFSHNGSAAIVEGDRLVVAIQEERLTRQKYARIHGSEPALCIEYCLRAAGVTAQDLDLVVVATQGHSSNPLDDVYLNPQLRLAAHRIRTISIGHHLAHAWSAYACSGFSDAAVLVVDGVGSPFSDLDESEKAAIANAMFDPWETISIYHASGDEMRPVWKDAVNVGRWLAARASGMAEFGSLGGMYESVADLLFRESLDAGKVMGLAPFGKPRFPVSDFFEPEISGFRYFQKVPETVDHSLTYKKSHEDAANLAASVQLALEHGILWLVRLARDRIQSTNLCYAGGVALNSVANQKIFTTRLYQDIFIMPAAEDAGVSVGAAYYGAVACGQRRQPFRLKVDNLGKTYSNEDIERASQRTRALKTKREDVKDTAQRLAKGQIIGFFSGGSEFGPRSLGSRSILADPRSTDAKDRVNSRIKHREAFRPFAPAVLESEAADWFEFEGTDAQSPFMLRVLRVAEDKAKFVPAIVHVDRTARIQTVSDSQPQFHSLLRAFFELTGIPLLLNTSFNVMSEPIVETPEEALYTLLENDLDAVRFDDRIIERSTGPVRLMDLVPRRRSETMTVERTVAGATPDRQNITVRVDPISELGSFTVAVTRRELSLLQLCDGAKTLSKIYQNLSDDKGFLTPEETISLAVGMRRRGLIEYVFEPDANIRTADDSR